MTRMKRVLAAVLAALSLSLVTVLAADSIGIGSCWINFVVHFFETPEGKALQKEFGVDENYLSVGSFILGYPNETPQPKPRNEGCITIIR